MSRSMGTQQICRDITLTLVAHGLKTAILTVIQLRFMAQLMVAHGMRLLLQTQFMAQILEVIAITTKDNREMVGNN